MTRERRMAISIRRLGPGDEDVLEDIAGEADDFDLPGASAPEPPLPPDEAAAYLSDPSVLHWVAEEEGDLVGELLCHVLRLPSGDGRELLLYAIGVRSAHRRRGIGTALVGEMLALGARRRASARSGCSPTTPERRPSTPPAASPAAAKGNRAS